MGCSVDNYIFFIFLETFAKKCLYEMVLFKKVFLIQIFKYQYLSKVNLLQILTNDCFCFVMLFCDAEPVDYMLNTDGCVYVVGAGS